MQQIDREVVDHEPDGCDTEETEVLPGNVGVFIMERPDAVQDIVRGRRTEEPQRIGQVLVQAQPLLAKVSDPEINEDSYRTLSGHRSSSTL